MARDLKEKLFEIDSKKIELDFIQHQFLIECKRFAAQAIEGVVRRAVSSNSAKAMALGKEGLRPIKDQVNKILDDISDNVETVINRDELWMHKKEISDTGKLSADMYTTKGKTGPELLEIPIKKILSPVGELLTAHELDNEQNWEKTQNFMKYRHNLEWSHEMCKCMDQYNRRFNELVKLMEEYKSICRQNSGNEALDLWDSL